jgi:hypothetical protein
MVRAALFSIFYFIFYIAPASAQYADVLSIQLPAGGMRKNVAAVAIVESPSLALDTAIVLWKLDGQEIARGIGTIEAAITLKDIAEHELSVTIAEKGGVTRTEKVSVRASDIDILWEAETLTPPQYTGRALPSVESTIRVEVVLNNGKNSAPGTHIYTWKMNGRTLPSSSGLGKNTLRIQLPTFENSALLQVSVRGIAGEFTGQTSVRIQTVEPRILFYEKKPLLGLWTSTTAGASMPTADGLLVSAFPYFVTALSQRDKNLEYAWTLPSGSDASAGDSASPADVRIVGTEPFSVSVVNKKTLLQEARGRNALRTLGGETGTGAFGIK